MSKGEDTLGRVNVAGWIAWLGVLGALVSLALIQTPDGGVVAMLVIVGSIGVWRYGVGAIHFVRGLWFQNVVFPQQRRKAEATGYAPSHVYYLITSYRVPWDVTARVFTAAFEEAKRTGWPSTIVASVVDPAERALATRIFRELDLPDGVGLSICSDPGSGKREAIALALEQIGAVQSNSTLVALIDGDTLLEPGAIGSSAPLFGICPDVGGLTTNERCHVRAGRRFRAWYQLRFAQRHMSMSSMALGKSVLTLTGRMSVIRGHIATSPQFIDAVRNDALSHWRLGGFRFLTGDDKSTWMAVVASGWRTYYVPDVLVTTIEDPPAGSFFSASTALMFRWYGNSLRQNLRSTSLGPRRLGWFAYFVLLDQRVSMWTTLIGPSVFLFSIFTGAIAFASIYVAWIALTRTGLSLLLALSGHPVHASFPALMYYNQVVGSVVKVKAIFYLDQQSWTRQKTRLNRGLTVARLRLNAWTSGICLTSAATAFAAFISMISILS